MARASRVVLDMALSGYKTVRPNVGKAWQYAKVELTPPMTAAFFQGEGGKKLESAVAGVFDGFMNSIEERIREMDAAELRKKQEKEAAIKAAEEKIKAEAIAKQEEKKKKAAAAAKEAAEKAKKETADKAKKEETAKAVSKTPPKTEKKK